MDEVVVTGACAITPFGVGRVPALDPIFEGTSAVSESVGVADRRTHAKRACQLKSFRPESWLDPAKLRRLDRPAILATVAAKLALEDAGIDASAHAERIGLVLGTGFGGLGSTEAFHRGVVQQG